MTNALANGMERTFWRKMDFIFFDDDAICENIKLQISPQSEFTVAFVLYWLCDTEFRARIYWIYGERWTIEWREETLEHLFYNTSLI